MARIIGREKVVARLNGMAGEKTVRAVGQALFEGGELIRAYAAHMITEGSVSGANHVPSLAGEFPNEDTGDLRIHIETTQPAPLRVEVSSNSGHSLPLEVGTSKMAARPHMQPSARAKRKEVIERVRQAVDRAVKG